MWAVICVIIMVFSFVMVPIEKAVYRRIRNNVFAYLVTFIIAAAILLSLYGIAALLGFNVWK